jgi:hypothetical protein
MQAYLTVYDYWQGLQRYFSSGLGWRTILKYIYVFLSNIMLDLEFPRQIILTAFDTTIFYHVWSSVLS